MADGSLTNLHSKRTPTQVYVWLRDEENYNIQHNSSPLKGVKK
jgi:hypothetical protein